ncbi:MAG: OmpA family protein [Oscillospiraceae bacterium]|jgi:outer membrane protein OmpA-like peptidoglycan-associated protein|nr:OmpA family protein [Oscillospiraceae bacterium]
MKKMITILFAALLCVLCLTGCGDTPLPAEAAVSIVLGDHGNSYALNLSNPDLVSAVASAAANGYISVVRCDGQPELVSADIYAVPAQYRNADPQKLQNDARQRAAKILANLTGVKAEQPELDTLEALWTAVDSFDAAPDCQTREVIVIDTGLSTKGKLDFRGNLLSADPAVIADFLDEQGALPDFTGITVKWFQLGDVAQPQAPLSHGQVNQLKQIWTAIIEKKGGTVEFSKMPAVPRANDPADYPAISTVPLPPETTLLFDPTKATIFTEQQMRFIAETANYIDPAAAMTALRPAAEYMVAYPQFTALLIGTTATGNRERCLKLSNDRAVAVRDTLISLGVPKRQIVTMGLGFDDPWHIPDTDTNGNWIEALAAQNRKVVLMDAASQGAKDILHPS